MGKIKKFIGEYAYKNIKNIAYSEEAIRSALITPRNARAVFSELTEYEVKSIVSDMSTTGTIGKVEQATQEEIKDIFAENGYTTVIFDDEEAISKCVKYYKNNEIICTYNNLKGRMNEYHMIVAIKENIDNIKRSDNPQRDDEYGTSILNIQIAKNGSHMSIKNRYNHTVSQCDSTLDNDLNRISMGLQNKVLGYYGFAGLKRNNNYYRNIVNIGNVYLKYHTERNNIYFGDFVLDGVHGARYIDAGKYYITISKNPIVLDFQNKKAIDLASVNSKTSLITRAMQEGLLHSGNKEQAETICATFIDVKKELLQTNRKSLKYISEVYGYDFQKPHKITGILGKFTANSIKKITGNDNAILLLTDDNCLNVVELNKGKFNARDINKTYKYNLSNFYTQGKFEEYRKSGKAGCYIIQQDEKYFRKIKKEQGRAGRYINGRFKYYDEMDNLEIGRIKLQDRLRIYKESKRKKEVQAIDYTKELIEIERDFAVLKNKITQKFVKASTTDDYNLLADIVNYKLTWLVKDIGEFRHKVATKGFTSTQQSEDLINDIKTRINNSMGKIS